MATTEVFISVATREVVGGELTDSGVVIGATSAAGAWVELRIRTIDTVTPTGITRRDVCIILEEFERQLINGGIDGMNTLLPVS